MGGVIAVSGNVANQLTHLIGGFADQQVVSYNPVAVDRCCARLLYADHHAATHDVNADRAARIQRISLYQLARRLFFASQCRPGSRGKRGYR